MLNARCVIALLAVGATAAMAQIPPPGAPPLSPRLVFFEAVAFPTADSTLVRVDVHYRIEKDFFVSQREVAGGDLGSFQQRGEVLVELMDPSGISRDRSLDRIELKQAEAHVPRPGEKQWVQGMMSLTVPPGTYKISMEVTDLQSQQRFTEQIRMLEAAAPHRDSLGLSTLFFVTPPAPPQGRQKLEVLNYGGDVLFGAPASAYVELFHLKETDSTASVSMRLSVFEPGSRESDSADFHIDATLPLMRHQRLDPAGEHGQGATYVVTDTLTAAAGLIITLPAPELLLRVYDLTITIRAGSRTASLKRPLRVLWPDMPASLRDVDYALNAMRYIVPENVLDSLQSGSFENRRNNLEGFWRPKDQTPGTAYNELMTQYYRRVDHATKAFGTLKQPDGMRTDRGKIYILYGPPTRTDRSLDPGLGFRETWTYEKLKRSFVFVDRARNGTYVLEPGSGS